MQKQSGPSLIAIASSILLPYGMLTAGTPIMITNQYWFFPFWTYIHDFGNWLEFGHIIPAFTPSFSLLPPIMGLVWFILGLYVSIALHQFYSGNIDAKSVWLPTLCILVLQMLVTIIVGFIVWNRWLDLVVPLPLHFLIVLVLVQMEIKEVIDEQ